MSKVRKRTWETKTGERVAWVADYFAPAADGKKRRHTKTFKTRREANAWLAHTVVEIKQGVHTPAHRSPSVIEAGEAWIAQAQCDGLERSTVVQYRQLLDLHIRPYLGHVKLAELSVAAVQSFRGVLTKQGRSRVMADRVVSALGSIIAEAMTTGKVARNVVREAATQNKRRARVEKRHANRLEVGVDIPTKDEIRAMLEHAGRWRPLVVTGVHRIARIRIARLDLVCRRSRPQDADRPAACRPVVRDGIAQKRLGPPRGAIGTDRCQHAQGMETRLSGQRARPGVSDRDGQCRIFGQLAPTRAWAHSIRRRHLE